MVCSSLLFGMVFICLLCGVVWSQTVTGGGSTLTESVHQKLIEEYSSRNLDAKLLYQPVGSIGGLLNLTQGVYNYAASDSVPSDLLYQEYQDLQLLPLLAGPIAIIYNLPVPELAITPLKLSRQAIVNIFSGKITTWNHPLIQQSNPQVTLPSNSIIRVARSDGSGTTEIFTDALSLFDPTGFGATIGKTNLVRNWGNETASNLIRVRGAPAVSTTVFSTPYSISYNVLNIAISSNNRYATVENKVGQFIIPSIESVQNAINDFGSSFTARFTADLVDAPGNYSYPIVGYSYIAYLSKNNSNFQQTRVLFDYLRFIFSDEGSLIINKFNFVPITHLIRIAIHDVLNLMESKGQVIARYFYADLNQDYIIKSVLALVALFLTMLIGVFFSFSKIIDTTAAAHLSQILFYYVLPARILYDSFLIDSFWIDFRWDIVLSSFFAIVIVYILSLVFFLIAHFRSKNILGKAAVLSLSSSLPSTILISYPVLSFYDSFSTDVGMRVYSIIVFALTMITIVPFSILLLEIHLLIVARVQKIQISIKQRVLNAIKSICSCIFAPPMIAIYIGMVFYIIRTSLDQKDFGSPFAAQARLAVLYMWYIPASACDFLCFFTIGMFMTKQKIFSYNIIKPAFALFFKVALCPVIAYGLAQGFVSLYRKTVVEPIIPDTSAIFASVIISGIPSSQLNLFISAQYKHISSNYLGPIYIIGSFFAMPVVFIAISFTQLSAEQLFLPLFIITNSSMSLLLRIMALFTCLLTILGTVWTFIPILIHKKYRNSTRRMVSILCFVQFIRAMAIVIGILAGVFSNSKTLVFFHPVSCLIQGIFIQFSNSASLILYSSISLHLLLRFAFQKKFRFFVELFYYIFAVAYGIVAVLPGIIGHIIDSKEFGFGFDENGWCWLANNYFQIIFFYIPFLLSAIFSIICLIAIQIRLWRRPSGQKLKTKNDLREVLLVKCSLFIGLYILFYIWGFIHSIQTWIAALNGSDATSSFVFLFLDNLFSCGQGVVTFFVFGTGATLLDDYKLFFSNIYQKIREKIFKKGPSEEDALIQDLKQQVTKLNKLRWKHFNSETRSNIFSFGNMFLLTMSAEEVEQDQELLRTMTNNEDAEMTSSSHKHKRGLLSLHSNSGLELEEKLINSVEEQIATEDFKNK